METSINFVQNRRKKLTKNQANDFKVLKIVAGLFGILIIVLGATFGVYFYLGSQVKDIKDQQKTLEKQILSKKSTEEDVVVSAAKLEILLELFDLRYDKQAAISYFSEIFGDKVLIRDITYDASNKILSLRLQSESIFILEEVFDKLANPEVEERFGEVNKSELSRGNEGKYGMAITLDLREKEVVKPASKKVPVK
jgi:hypothetical protein